MAPRETTLDYYAILEVTQTATLSTIKSNYRRLALARHPDKNPDTPDSIGAFQLVSIVNLVIQ